MKFGTISGGFRKNFGYRDRPVTKMATISKMVTKNLNVYSVAGTTGGLPGISS